MNICTVNCSLLFLAYPIFYCISFFLSPKLIFTDNCWRFYLAPGFTDMQHGSGGLTERRRLRFLECYLCVINMLNTKAENTAIWSSIDWLFSWPLLYFYPNTTHSALNWVRGFHFQLIVFSCVLAFIIWPQSTNKYGNFNILQNKQKLQPFFMFYLDLGLYLFSTTQQIHCI